jgi:hypothetical protein
MQMKPTSWCHSAKSSWSNLHLLAAKRAAAAAVQQPFLVYCCLFALLLTPRRDWLYIV